jgi:hypothetical protein
MSKIFDINPMSKLHYLMSRIFDIAARRRAPAMSDLPQEITPSPHPFDMTFREKSIAAQFICIGMVYGYYGVRLWGRSLTPAEAMAALIEITVLMILISVAFHLAIRWNAKPERPDERDLTIGLRGTRNAYRVLAVGVWCVLLLAMTQMPYSQIFYATMGAFALAELVRLGSQIAYYRFSS